MESTSLGAKCQLIEEIIKIEKSLFGKLIQSFPEEIINGC